VSGLHESTECAGLARLNSKRAIEGAILTAVASGLTAGQWQLEDAKLKGNLLLHLIFALSASGMIWLLCGWRVRQRRFPERPPGVIYIVLALATVLLIALAGHLGGIVSGVESGAN
jgi:uncharacterized membrane protein